jgi:hypothetical protein
MSRSRRRRAQSANINAEIGFDPTRSVPDPKFRPVSLANAKEGWRAWRVKKELPAYGLAPRLMSATYGYDWAPKRKAEADCQICADPDMGGEGVPGVECSCGFYSAKSLRHLMQMGYHLYTDIDEAKEFKIIGQVACWGKVVEGTQGWRSQYAYPTYLILPFEMGVEFGTRIRESFGCKVRLMNFLKQPYEITDEFVQGLLDGKPHFEAPKPEPKASRRVGHKHLKFLGRTVSEPYMKADVKVIDVVWDVTADKPGVPTKMDDLEFERI